MSLTWSLDAGVLHVRYESGVAKAEVWLPSAEWRLEWSGESPDLVIAGWRFNGFALHEPCADSLTQMRLPVGWEEGRKLWQAITGGPRPTRADKPHFCPNHKTEPLRKEGALWRCRECDREAAPKAVSA